MVVAFSGTLLGSKGRECKGFEGISCNLYFNFIIDCK